MNRLTRFHLSQAVQSLRLKENGMKVFIVALFMMVSSVVFAVPTTLTVQELSETEYTQSLTAVDTTNGNRVSNPNGDIFFILSNPGGVSGSVVIDAVSSSVEVPGYGPLTKADLTVALGATTTKLIGPFAKRAWNDSSGYVQLTFTGTGSNSLTVKALKLKPSLLN